jgi:ATP-dependent RNA helicase SUPV3L1/SUV3
VKGLDQPSRATLRIYGVRFGDYHIFLTALLKPAPRALATQLWALKHEPPDAKGVADLLHLAASGRTSIPTDKETPNLLYRSAGYRVCGERAVRVDILERLADLIRPALAWREHVQGTKPDGAVDGRSFTVTGAMTSLTGASGDDFASILRALGYRMERRPKPPEAEKPSGADAAATQSASETSTKPTAEVASQTPIESVPLDTMVGVLPGAELLPISADAAEVVLPQHQSQDEPAPSRGDDASAQAAVEPASAQTGAPEPGKAEEAAFYEVWRPAGRSERRPHRPRHSHRPPPAAEPAEGGESASTARLDASAKEEAPRERRHRDGRHEKHDRQARQDRHERQQRKDHDATRADRQDGGGRRHDRSRHRRREGERIDRAEREKYFAKPHGGSDRRDKQPDPNSPFAKLAALKQQLEQNGKEPS